MKKIQITLERLLVGIWMLKVLLVRFHREMRNMIGNWRKGNSCYTQVENLDI